jgi:hypothetical protein
MVVLPEYFQASIRHYGAGILSEDISVTLQELGQLIQERGMRYYKILGDSIHFYSSDDKRFIDGEEFVTLYDMTHGFGKKFWETVLDALKKMGISLKPVSWGVDS